MFPGDGENFESLINASDNAMYFIKRQQKNGFAFLADLPEAERRDQVCSPST